MDLTTVIVVIVFTSLFFGFIVFLGIYSRRNGSREMPPNDTETGLGGE